ncbi:hypothetical protein CPC735_003520 [Coccidioides posadasii C735 delta SOWgp]|uniref:Mid2 domain-containing protein n=1 Tax=Coccidioides posadasii (strain C735) TaxID=222929 RepID=C5P8X1_COCP7|nr:hypothetical protein CPC735_003520 [Coccidioides posadasii C735 delta SOWgp]EER26183.1 hypothetical protein CPC735_003520 [Coccidioides posadasii C735 delta SOWgp]|eukprot:XP_003068328.1 hypothetical protein CPC735_003520 [Coccidioides posadasii C735 delta SOWgp]
MKISRQEKGQLRSDWSVLRPPFCSSNGEQKFFRSDERHAWAVPGDEAPITTQARKQLSQEVLKPWPCPGPNDIQCCVKNEDITSAEPSTTQKTKDSTKTTTETRETSSKITITSESSDEPSTTSSTSSSSSPSSSTLTSSSLFFSTVTVTPSPVSTSSIPQTISSTSLLPSQTTTQPVSDSNRKLSSAQLGGIAVGSIAAGFALILFIIFILMRIARARHNKKIAREGTLYQTQMPSEMPDSGFGSNAISAVGAATMRSKNRTYMRMGTEYDNDKHSPVGNGAGEGYELEPRPAYRPFRPHHAEAMVELDGSPTTREKGRRHW